MKNVLKESKFISLLYTVLGLAIIGSGFALKIPGFAWMGVSIVLLGVIVSLAMKQAHLIYLMKKAGLWDPIMPAKKKKGKTVQPVNQDLKDQTKQINKDFEIQDEKEVTDEEIEKQIARLKEK
jgi:hypothetical protein